MHIGTWFFRPGWMPTITTVVLFPLLILLGNWQLDRADQKVALYELYQNRGLLDQVNINQSPLFLNNHNELLWRKARVTGQYVEDKMFLLDNQVVNGVVGYFVYSPIKLEQGTKRLLVNRGWVPAGSYRNDVPVIEISSGNVTINGVIKDPPLTGIVLSDNIVEDMGNRIVRLQNIDIDNIGKLLGTPVYPFVMRLEPSSATGFVRNWPQPGSGSERHHGYAFQWFTMAAILLIIFIVLNSKRHRTDER